MTNKAFLLGINTSGLKYCENDVRLMKECLEMHSFEVQIASTSIKRDIVDQFERWIDNMNKTDTALFYYSGHGFAPKGKLLLVLNDELEKVSSKLDINIITDALEECKAINKLVVLDCCRAGTVENTWAPQQSDFYRILTASERLEKGKEIDNLKASFLTYQFHNALFINYQDLVDKNYEIRLNILYERLKRQAELHNQESKNIRVPIPNLLGNQKADFILSIIAKKKYLPELKTSQIVKQNLPQRFYSKFVGRRKSLKKLLKFISPEYRQHITVIDGIGGVGKTALAIEAAYLCWENSLSHSSLNTPIFDAIIFTSAKQKYLMPSGILPRPMYETTLQDIFRTIATVLNDPTITQLSGREQISRVKQKIKEQSTLLIIDNLETVEKSERKKVLSFINDIPFPTKVIITTRDQVLGYDAAIRLNQLSMKEGIQLIKQQAGEKEIQITTRDATRIYSRFGGIPVALIYVVGQKFMGYSLDGLTDRSKPLPKDITSFCFETSIKPLRGQVAFKLLMSSAIFQDSPRKEAIATVAGFTVSSNDVITGLARLVQLSLLKQREEDHFSMLTITREYVLNEVNENKSDFKILSRERLVNWYLDFVKKYGGNDWENWRYNYDKLGKEWKNIESVLFWCASHKRYKNVRDLWKNLDNYVDIAGYWQNRNYWWQWLIKESRRNLDFSTYIEGLSEKGWTLTLIGNKHHHGAVRILAKAWWKSRKHADFIIQANLVNHIAINRITKKKYKQALQWLEREEKFIESAKLDEPNYFRHHVRISYYRGEIHFRQENYDLAKKLFEWVCNQGTEIGWQRFVNYAQNWLADILIIQDSLQEAEKLLDKGIAVAQANREKRRIGHYQATYARLEVKKNNLEKAKKWAIKALSCFKQENIQEDAQEMEDLIEIIPSKLDL